MSTQLDVITIGEAMAMFVAKETGDLAAAESFVKRVAGAELNVATGLARLGLNVGWVSRVGNDSFGRYVLQQLAKERINSHGVTTDERYATGFQLKSKEENQKKYDKKIVTEVMPLINYYKAEEYHQKYLKKNPNGYCHIKL